MKLEKFLETYPLWSAYKLHERLVVPMQKMLKEQDLTFLQSLIMAAIYFQERSVSPRELVLLFGTSLPNISHSLKHLWELGFLEREIDQNDLRKVGYKVTPQASACLDNIIGIHHHAQETLERAFSQQEIARWCEMATKISRIF